MDTRELQVVIKGDASDYKRAMDDIDQKSQKGKSGFHDLTVGAAGFAAEVAALGVATFAFGKSALDAFNESERANAQLNAVLQSTGQAIGWTSDNAKELSNNLQKLNAIDDDSVTSLQAMLLTFTNIGKDIFPQVTQTAIDMATAMNGGVIPSAEELRSQAIQLGKALQDPDAGLGVLKRVGVNVDELKKKFTDGMPIQEKQKLILQELATEFGGSGAAAAKTFGGQIAALQVNFGNLMEAIGGTIAGVLRPAIDWFNRWFDSMGGAEGVMDRLKNAFEVAKPYIEGLAIAIGVGLVAALGVLAVAWAASPVGMFTLAVTAAGLAIGQIIKWMGGWDNMLKQMQPAINWFKNAWEQIVNVWNTVLLPAFKIVYDQFKTQLLPALQELWEHHGPQIIQVLTLVAALIGGTFVASLLVSMAVISAFIAIFTGIINAITWVGDQIKGWWNMQVNAWNMAVEQIKGFINGFVSFFSNLPYNIGVITGQIVGWFMRLPDNVANMVSAMISWFSQLPGRAGGLFNSLVATIQAWLNQLPGRAQNTASSIVNGFIGFLQGLPGMVGGIFNSVVNIVAGWAGALFNRARQIAGNFWEGFKQGLGIHSPSYIERAFMAIGDQSQLTLAQMTSDLNRLNDISFGSFNTLLGPQGGSSITDNSSSQNNRIDVTIMGNAGAQEVQDGLLNGLRIAARGI